MAVFLYLITIHFSKLELYMRVIKGLKYLKVGFTNKSSMKYLHISLLWSFQLMFLLNAAIHSCTLLPLL